MVNAREEHTEVNKIRDRLLLIGAALLVCVLGVGAFAVADAYHINPAWVFFGWNSILLIPVVGGDFRTKFKQPRFVLFFLVWMAVHGALVVWLMRALSIEVWMLAMAIELAIGYFVAFLVFGEEETAQKPEDEPN